MKTSALLTVSHAIALACGFAAGVYSLPLLTAPPGPSDAEVARAAAEASFRGEFRRDLKDSDVLHWGEGIVSVSRERIALSGRLAPGPDYKLYLSPVFVETEAEFARLKPAMARVGDVKTFDGFVLPVPPGIDVTAFTSVVIWCESFGQFITAARYR